MLATFRRTFSRVVPSPFPNGSQKQPPEPPRLENFTEAIAIGSGEARTERAPAAERRLTVWPVRLGNEGLLRKKAQFFGALRAQRLHGIGRRSAAQKLSGYLVSTACLSMTPGLAAGKFCIQYALDL